MTKINNYAEFMAEAERLDPEGFARRRAERTEFVELCRDAARYRWLRAKTRGIRGVDNYPAFAFPSVPIPSGLNIMQGSVAQHLDTIIDYAIAHAFNAGAPVTPGSSNATTDAPASAPAQRPPL